MLPVYKATAIDQEALLGGSTRPCLMTVMDDKGDIAGSYVVKIFKHYNTEQYNPTNKELYGNVLAKEFDLNTPKPALIQVNNSLISQLKKSDRYKNWDIISGTYFGCELVENTLDFNQKALQKSEQWEIENVFAFDVLIRNVDRRVSKPNMFFKDGSIILIDHELSLNIDRSFDSYLQIENAWRFITNEHRDARHLFLDYLKKQNKKEEVTFNDFLELLRTLNLRQLDEVANQLEDLGLYPIDYVPIKAYLREVKQNPHAFAKLLKKMLQ
ncbi:MAG: HipA family kinase [Chitinophagales bacterium]